jgi:hypothetical protein
MSINKKGKLESLGIVFKPLNINELQIIFPNINYEVEVDVNGVNSISYELENVSIGDRYACSISNNSGTFNIDYKVNNITLSQKYPKLITIKESEYNTATMFVLPLVFENKDIAAYIQNNTGYLLNCFIDCDFIIKKDNYSIFVLMKFSKSERYKLHEEYFLSMPTFVNKEDISEKYVVYEFSIPVNLRKDFNLLLNGKYSKISKFAKNMILGFHGASVEGNMVDKIINKSPELLRYYADKLDVSFEDLDELYKKFDYRDVLTQELL